MDNERLVSDQTSLLKINIHVAMTTLFFYNFMHLKALDTQQMLINVDPQIIISVTMIMMIQYTIVIKSDG